MSRVGFSRLFAFSFLIIVFALSGYSAYAQNDNQSDDQGSSLYNKDAAAKKQQPEVDPLKRPLTEKQKKANAKALKQELGNTYNKWLDEDVRWIITDEERSAFMKLSNYEERDQFI